MFSLILRVLVGFLLACLAGGLTTVLFAWSPSELAGMPTDPMEKLALMFPVATHAALFSAPFALVAIALGEWQKWRDWSYYAAAGIVIAMIGYFAQYQSQTESLGWSVADSSYPLVAFLTTGFVAGLTYWMFSGRLIEPPRYRNHSTSQPRGSPNHQGHAH